MPIYDLQCVSCGNLEEVNVHHAEVDKIRCNKCGDRTSINWLNHTHSFKIRGFAARNGYCIPRLEDDK